MGLVWTIKIHKVWRWSSMTYASDQPAREDFADVAQISGMLTWNPHGETLPDGKICLHERNWGYENEVIRPYDGVRLEANSLLSRS